MPDHPDPAFTSALCYDTREELCKHFPFVLVANEIEFIYFRTASMRDKFFSATDKNGRPTWQHFYAALRYPSAAEERRAS